MHKPFDIKTFLVDIKTIAQNILDAHLLFNTAKKDFYSVIDNIRFGRTHGVTVVIPIGINYLHDSVLKANNASRILKKIEKGKIITRVDLLKLYIEFLRLNKHFTDVIHVIEQKTYISGSYFTTNTVPPVHIEYIEEKTSDDEIFNFWDAGLEEAEQIEETAIAEFYNTLNQVTEYNFDDKGKMLEEIIKQYPQSFTDIVYEYFLHLIHS